MFVCLLLFVVFVMKGLSWPFNSINGISVFCILIASMFLLVVIVIVVFFSYSLMVFFWIPTIKDIVIAVTFIAVISRLLILAVTTLDS